MEIYVQEAWSVQFLHALPADTKQLVLDGARAFPWLLEKACGWHHAKVPERIWHILLRRMTFEQKELGEDELGERHTFGQKGPRAASMRM